MWLELRTWIQGNIHYNIFHTKCCMLKKRSNNFFSKRVSVNPYFQLVNYSSQRLTPYGTVSIAFCFGTLNPALVTSLQQIYFIPVTSLLLYICSVETWTILKEDLNKLAVFQIWCISQILDISLRNRFSDNIQLQAC